MKNEEAPSVPPKGGRTVMREWFKVQGSRGVDWLEFALQMVVLSEMTCLISVSVSKISDLSLFSFILHAISQISTIFAPK